MAESEPEAKAGHGGSTQRHLDALLARYADGDRDAFDPLFSAAWPVVLRFCRRYVQDPTEAEDVAQRTMIKLADQAPNYDRARPALTWILTIAAWEARTARRRRHRNREDAVGDAPIADRTDPADGPEARVAQDQLVEALFAAIDRLPALDRQTLLDDLRAHTDPHLAPTTQRKRRQRALERLRGIWRLTHESPKRS